MLAQLGLEGNLQSVALLARPYLNGQPMSAASLRDGFQRHVEDSQSEVPRAALPEVALIGPDHPTSAPLHALFEKPPGISDPETDTTPERLTDACRLLTELSPEWNALLDTVIDSFVWSNRPEDFGSETRSTAVGVIWLNLAPQWTPKALCEVIVHETTHSLTFVDERRYGHYRDLDAMMDRTHFVSSAIRAEPRPLYASLHSILVGAELLAWRRRCGDIEPGGGPHPDSATLHRNSLEAIKSVRELPELDAIALPRVDELLARAEEVLEEV